MAMMTWALIGVVVLFERQLLPWRTRHELWTEAALSGRP
jgi:hypothetical protein